MKNERLHIIPGLYTVLIKDEKILLSRRYNTGYADGEYSLAGGHLDDDESYKDAIIRETEEELGIDLDPMNLRAIHVMHRKQNGNRIDIFFASDTWFGEPRIMESEKCDDIRWFPINKLPYNIIPFIRQSIEKIQKNEFYGDFGF